MVKALASKVPEQGSSLYRYFFCKSNVFTRLAMTWWIRSNILFYWVFFVVLHLVFILYLFSIHSFFNGWPSNSFLWSYLIISGLGYLHNHVCSTSFDMVAACLSLYFIISDHLFFGSIMVSAFSMRGFILPYPLILYGPIRYTNNMSHEMAFDSVADKWPYFKLHYCFSDKIYKPSLGYLCCTLCYANNSAD